MLPKKIRIKDSKEIANVFKNGYFSRQDFLNIKFIPNQKEFSRFGFSAGVSFSKKAVERNYLKRITSEAIRHTLAEIKPGYDIVVYFKNHPGKEITLEMIQSLLRDALIRAKILK